MIFEIKQKKIKKGHLQFYYFEGKIEIAWHAT